MSNNTIIPAQFAWASYDSSMPLEELKFVDQQDNEPVVKFHTTNNDLLFTISSSGLQYNFEKYPHDTSKQAAQKVFECLQDAKLLTALERQNCAYFRLKAYREYGEREIVFSTNGVTHNYTDVSLFYYHMFEHLTTLIRKKYA